MFMDFTATGDWAWRIALPTFRRVRLKVSLSLTETLHLHSKAMGIFLSRCQGEALARPAFLRSSLAIGVLKSALLTIPCFLGSGCTSTIQLKVLDANTSQPLAGVSAVWRDDSAYNLLTGSRHQTGPTNLAVSGMDGIITISGVHNNWFGRLTFSRLGYQTNYGIYYHDRLDFSQRIMPSPLPQDLFILEDPRTYASLTNGCFLIPMPR